MKLSNMGKKDKSYRIPAASAHSGIAVRRLKAEIFQSLAHPVRIHIIELLRDGELPAGTIAERVGLEPSSLSQHLLLLRSRRLIVGRRDGNQIFYSLLDKVVFDILDAMRRHLQGHLEEAMAILAAV